MNDVGLLRQPSNECDDIYHAVRDAFRSGSQEQCRGWLEKLERLDPPKRWSRYFWVVEWAAEGGNLEVFRQLLALGGKIDKFSLVAATLCGHGKLVEYQLASMPLESLSAHEQGQLLEAAIAGGHLLDFARELLSLGVRLPHDDVPDSPCRSIDGTALYGTDEQYELLCAAGYRPDRRTLELIRLSCLDEADGAVGVGADRVSLLMQDAQHDLLTF